MARKGKIARLSNEVREELNSRLRDGAMGEPLLEWLNSLPATRAVLDAEFEGKLINKQNLSEWRQGGYRDWLAGEVAIAEVREIVSATQKSGGPIKVRVNDRLGAWVALKYAAAIAGRDEGKPDWKHLREMCQDVTKLRREDHEAILLRLEAEKMKEGQK